jgi:hypothetical protein
MINLVKKLKPFLPFMLIMNVSRFPDVINIQVYYKCVCDSPNYLRHSGCLYDIQISVKWGRIYEKWY